MTSMWVAVLSNINPSTYTHTHTYTNARMRECTNTHTYFLIWIVSRKNIVLGWNQYNSVLHKLINSAEVWFLWNVCVSGMWYIYFRLKQIKLILAFELVVRREFNVFCGFRLLILDFLWRHSLSRDVCEPWKDLEGMCSNMFVITWLNLPMRIKK